MGKPVPEVTWLKDLAPLESDERIIIDSNGSLIITSIVMSDAGDYLCFFNDRDGVEHSTVTIKVSPRQATPTTLTGDDTICELMIFMSFLMLFMSCDQLCDFIKCHKLIN